MSSPNKFLFTFNVKYHFPLIFINKVLPMLSLNATPSIKFLLTIQINVIYISFELWYNFIFDHFP